MDAGGHALERRVELWVRAVPAEGPWPALEDDLALLDAEERARFERFRFERHRALYAAAHALVRRVLSHHDGRDPGAWRFDVGERGKPRIREPGALPLSFNLSHTEGYAAVGVTSGCALGVDVEAAPRLGRPEDIAHRYFSPREVEGLLALPVAARRERFLDLWSLKEAYIKARGLGLAIPLASFSFLLDGDSDADGNGNGNRAGSAVAVHFESGADVSSGPEADAAFTGHGDARDWQFERRRFDPAVGCGVALCPGRGRARAIHLLDAETLSA